VSNTISISDDVRDVCDVSGVMLLLCCLYLADHRMSFFQFSIVLAILGFTASDSLFGIFNLFLILISNIISLQFQISFAYNSYNDWHR